jgi:DNA-binding transcriptional ArsR family regulator
VHAFDVLGDPVRRRILELLAEGELTSGAVCTVIQREFGISQPGVSAHLRVLREAGMVEVRGDAQRRLYRVRAEPLRAVDGWLAPYRAMWASSLDDLERHLETMSDS